MKKFFEILIAAFFLVIPSYAEQVSGSGYTLTYVLSAGGDGSSSVIGQSTASSTPPMGAMHSLSAGILAAQQGGSQSPAPGGTTTVLNTAPSIEAKVNGVVLVDNAAIDPSAELTVDVTDDKAVDASSVNVTIDGQQSQLSVKSASAAMTSFTSTLSLSQGIHTIVLTASDTESATSTLTIKDIKSFSGALRVVGTPMNYPNPFKTSTGTTIVYTLSANAEIKLYIFDVAGQMVWQNIYPSAATGGAIGENQIAWSGKNSAGERLGNGAYYYIITSGGKTLGRGEMLIID